MSSANLDISTALPWHFATTLGFAKETRYSRGMPTETDPAPTPDVPPTLEGISGQMDEMLKQQREILDEQRRLATAFGVLRKRVEANTDHVMKLQQVIDPLTWKMRAVLTFGGSMAGGGLVFLVLRLMVALASHR